MIDIETSADRARILGLRAEDVEDLVVAAAQLEPDDHELIERWSAGLVQRIGRLDPASTGGSWPDDHDPGGLRALLALIDSAPSVAAYHRTRGVPAEISAATLADLGEQVWVHRQTYGSFGLHTQGWSATVWSGTLYALGRLQFELIPDPELAAWRLSTHIPEAGRLSPELVDDSFARARAFFPRHFPELTVTGFFCRSWLLDPRLPELLPDSNLARFQQRWTLFGPPQPGEVDTLFFVFRRRGAVPVDELPADTRLRRVTIDLLRDGSSWLLHDGRIPW